MAEPADLYAQVARIHALGIDRGFLTSLGEGFLAVLYEAVDACPEAVLFTEVDNGKVLGFVAAAEGMGPIYRQMLNDWPRLVRTLAPVALSPRKVWRIVELLRHKKRDETTGPGEVPKLELLSIAVAPAALRQGVARRLYFRLMDHARETGAPGFRIVVGDGLYAAKRFYTGMGAVPKTTVTVHGGSNSTVYVQRV